MLNVEARLFTFSEARCERSCWAIRMYEGQGDDDDFTKGKQTRSKVAEGREIMYLLFNSNEL